MERTKKELLEKVKGIDITYDYEETYTQLRNTVIDYMNESQDFELDYLFEDFVDYFTCEEYVKQQLNDGGLERLACCIGDVNFFNNEIFRINAYGNIENINIDDLKVLKDEIIDNLESE